MAAPTLPLVDDRPTRRRSALEAGVCLHRYNQIYNQLVDDGSDVSRRGTLFHVAAELYIRMLVAARTSADIGCARDAFISACERTVAPARTVFEAEKLFYRWAERFELKLDYVLLVETAISVVLHGETFEWTPDLVYADERGIVFYDWKTHFVAWTPEQARREFQARFYLYMARHAYPNQPRYEIRFVFVRTGEIVSVVFTAEDFVEIESQIEAALAAIAEADRTRTYPATGGPHCQYCRLDCPINGRDGLLPTRVEDERQAAAMASEYLALKQRTGQLRRLLAGFVRAEGPLELNGMRFEYEAVERTRYKVDDVQQVAAATGHDVSFLTVSGSELGPYTNPRKFPTLARELATRKISQTSYRFQATKTGAFILKGATDVDLFGAAADEDEDDTKEG